MVTDIKQICRTRLSFAVEAHKVCPGDLLVYEGFSVRVFGTDHGIPGVGYIFEEDMRPGRFNRERAIELGYAPGHFLGNCSGGGGYDYG
jgi:ribonuclease Z